MSARQWQGAELLMRVLQEKRKRDLGMQGGGRNYIEEEKRVARNFGFYSGFDT